MPPQRYECIVIGVGMAGAAACLALARRGCRVLGIERFEPGHDRGSSHGLSRIFRIAYYEHDNYVPLLRRAKHMWQAIECEAGTTLLIPTGGLWIGPRDSELIGGTLRSARANGLEHELLDAAEVRKRYPHIHMGHDIAGFFERDAGMLLPEHAIRTFVALAERAGAIIHAHEIVRTWRADDACVTVDTDRARYIADRLVICAGAWAGKLLAGAHIPITVTRQATAWFEVKQPEVFARAKHPCWAAVRSDRGFFYGFPLREGERSMKVSLHEVAEPCDPDTIDRTVYADEIDLLRAFLDRAMPGCFGEVTDTSICMYANSPDGHFIIDHHPGHPDRVTLAIGFSGHGFKFMPMIGEAVADLALDGATDLPIDFLSLDRLSGPARVCGGGG